MTKQEMLDFFDLMQDKANSPYYTDDQKIHFINVAILEVAKDYLQNTYPQLGESWMQQPQVVSHFHRNKVLHSIMQPLELKRVSVTSTALGVISFADIEAAMSALAGEPVTLLLVTGIPGYRHIHQMEERLRNNSFTAPSDTNKYYEPSKGGFFLYPEKSVTINLNTIKYPKMLTLDSESPSDMPATVHAEIMGLALSYVGIALSQEDIKTIKS